MEKNMNARQTVIKLSLVALISLLLLIPLGMIKGIIEEREESKDNVVEEVARSYAQQQKVSAPYLTSHIVGENEIKKADGKVEKVSYSKDCTTHFTEVDYKANVETDVLHRSIYDVIVYNSRISISGKFPVSMEAISAKKNTFCFEIEDQKGFSNPSQLTLGGQTFKIGKNGNRFEAEVLLPKDARIGDTVEFTISFDLKGTESLFFYPSKTGSTSLAISSPYPHPSFQGELLPNERNVRNDGFDATWNVSEYNSASYYKMGVKFVDPANPYQQSMRSAKYGMLIIILVFVAGLFVEFLTKKTINPIQYAIIGLSLVLFYSLLVAFSEFITFGAAYTIAASMTTVALMFYYKGILKNRSAYMLGGFVTLVYILNYILLQMETFALLSGSLVLFMLLCVVMYLTANINNKELPKTE